MNKFGINLIAMAGLAAIAGSASATNLTFTGMNLGNAETGFVGLDGGPTEDVYIGKINFTDGSHTITTVCADLESLLDGGAHPYNLSVTNPMGGTPVDHAGSIVAADFAGATTAAQQAGLQLAVWSTIYTGHTLNVSGVSSQALSYESQYLNDINFNGAAQYYNTSAQGGQSQLGAQAVPEPMSMGALAMGAIGLVRRRRKN